ncbi:MAG: hypothetical protein AABZ84_00210 [Pseudomonadota bacterium]
MWPAGCPPSGDRVVHAVHDQEYAYFMPAVAPWPCWFNMIVETDHVPMSRPLADHDDGMLKIKPVLRRESRDRDLAPGNPLTRWS